MSCVMTDQIDEPPGSGVLASSRRLDRVRPRIRRAGLFASGVAAALLAIALYGVLNPGPHQLTQREVSDTVAQALASQTPAPAVSQLVYDAVRPSLVLIQTESPGGKSAQNSGLGSGVIIDRAGDHVEAGENVAGADTISLTLSLIHI